MDIFGTQMKFSLYRRVKYTSLLGGFSSILAYITIIVFTFVFGKNFFYKTNPKILFKQERPDIYPPPIQINGENIVIPWRITDENDAPVNFTNIIYPIMSHWKYKIGETKNLQLVEVISLPLTKCNEKNANMTEFLFYFSIEDWYCFDDLGKFYIWWLLGW
jgi:hypothetical protein